MNKKLPDCPNCEAERRESSRLQKREHIAGCYDVYGDCTCKDLHDSILEECKQDGLRNLKYLSDANQEIAHQTNLKKSFEDQSWKLAEEIKRLRKALLVYADSANWDDGGFRREEANVIFCNPYGKDQAGYVIAKEALSPAPEVPKKCENHET